MDLRPWALLVTRNFPPLVGGMERLNQHLLNSLAPDWRVVLCGPRGAAAFATPGAVVSEADIRPLPSFLTWTAARAAKVALTLKPRLVVAGSGLCAPIAWVAGRLCGAQTAVYLHGLDIIVPSKLYQLAWLPFIRRCDIVIVNSANTSRLAQRNGVLGSRISILHPGAKIPVLDATAGPAFRTRHGLEDAAILLSVGRLTRRKGLTEFVALALPAIVGAYPNVVLAIIGDEASDALHGTTRSERARIQAAAEAAGVAGNVRFLGRCDEDDLGAAYQAANCHVFPVLELAGDVEGFGMVALESAAHGLPTVAFDVGGVADAVDTDRSGLLVAAGDYARLSEQVSYVLGRQRNVESVEASRQFARSKSWDAFGEQLRKLVRSAHG